MTVTTFTELKATIADFLNREDLTATIPTFISLAETDIQRKVKHWRGEVVADISLASQYTDLPSDFSEIIRLYITSSGTRPLELISQAELLDRKMASGNAGGEPCFYAITAGKLEVYPAPDAAYTAEIYYRARITPLSDSNADNWLLTYHSDAYLYGSLMHTAPYLQDDARLTVWAALYQQAVDAINTESERAKHGGSGLRMKIRSY